MPDLFPDISLDEQIGAVDREIRLREIVYPRRIASGKMSREQADRELARMKAVRATLKALRAE